MNRFEILPNQSRSGKRRVERTQLRVESFSVNVFATAEIDMQTGNRKEAKSQHARRPRTRNNRFIRRNESGWSNVPLRSFVPVSSIGKPELRIVLSLSKTRGQTFASSLRQLWPGCSFGFICFEPDETGLCAVTNLLPAHASWQRHVCGRIGSIEVGAPDDLAAIRKALSVVGADDPIAPVPVPMRIQYRRVGRMCAHPRGQSYAFMQVRHFLGGSGGKFFGLRRPDDAERSKGTG